MLNESKTEVLHLTSRFKRSPPFPNISICGAEIPPSAAVKDLGVTLDNTLQMRGHVREVARNASFYYTKSAKYVTSSIIHQQNACTAFVTSRLDYCNSLFYGLPARDLGRLQLVQNAAARLVTKIKRNDHHTLHQFSEIYIGYRLETGLFSKSRFLHTKPLTIRDLLTSLNFYCLTHHPGYFVLHLLPYWSPPRTPTRRSTVTEPLQQQPQTFGTSSRLTSEPLHL
ncbi:hypothetical protein BSL78_16865 [Apostichopus japonicus]|uniref:RNA-directed DNA polymerase from mobile element jockey-like n=1 Tax=Stichopus japonicus TaxID=307972 RepID=A0A2G8KE85_STIJA|nr:hypothetical protein BSL78_16865 [Apostichopus japonicus]